MAYVLLLIAFLFGLIVFRFGRAADWHWSGAVIAGLVPLGFTYFLGLLGLGIGGAFMAAVWRATA